MSRPEDIIREKSLELMTELKIEQSTTNQQAVIIHMTQLATRILNWQNAPKQEEESCQNTTTIVDSATTSDAQDTSNTDTSTVSEGKENPQP